VILLRFILGKARTVNYDSIPSTMDVVTTHINEDSPEVIIIIANKQLTGRGRDDSSWYSPRGGFYGTFVLPFDGSLDSVQMRLIHYIAALSVVTAVEELTEISVKVKWPNDIVISKRKLGGILLEVLSLKCNFLLIGIGINVNVITEDFAQFTDLLATSLYDEVKKQIDLNLMKEKIIHNILQNLELFQEKEVEGIIQKLNQVLFNKGKNHIYKDKEMVCEGIDQEGFLILKNDEKRVLVSIEKSKEIKLLY